MHDKYVRAENLPNDMVWKFREELQAPAGSSSIDHVSELRGSSPIFIEWLSGDVIKYFSTAQFNVIRLRTLMSEDFPRSYIKSYLSEDIPLLFKIYKVSSHKNYPFAFLSLALILSNTINNGNNCMGGETSLVCNHASVALTID
ncbi:hypothetical protein TNCV_2236161 [Trichonephila clavipes]|nr:hypothetical protein TNCV_2236161 [Trichonephila clavipes]